MSSLEVKGLCPTLKKPPWLQDLVLNFAYFFKKVMFIFYKIKGKTKNKYKKVKI